MNVREHEGTNLLARLESNNRHFLSKFTFEQLSWGFCTVK